MSQAGEQAQTTRRQHDSKFSWPDRTHLGDYALILPILIDLVILIVGLVVASIPTYAVPPPAPAACTRASQSHG